MTAALIVAALLICGMVLLIAEIAIIPGFGVAGIGAIALLVSGVAYAWVKFGASWGIGSLLMAAVAAVAILVIAPRTRAGKALVLETDLRQSHAGASHALKGKTGRTVTPLRPAGIAEIDGKRVDVVADGVFIDANQEVRVALVDGPRIVVEPIA
jgi:membrane-bound serine protease (ClpP class)